MGSVPPLLSFLLVIVSGWVHRHQLLVIEFLQAENQLLKERLRGKRILWSASRQDKPGKGGSYVADGNLSLESRGFDALPVKISHQPEASLA
jgi:hypothetical protein